jgi:hypothetical protein
VPEYPLTRIRGTRVPVTGTGMRRIGYGLKKKIVYPYPSYPSTRCTRARPTRRPPRMYPTRTRGTRRQITTRALVLFGPQMVFSRLTCIICFLNNSRLCIYFDFQIAFIFISFGFSLGQLSRDNFSVSFQRLIWMVRFNNNGCRKSKYKF